MKIYDQFYINGQWVEPVDKKLMDVINPSTEEVCAQISIGNQQDVDAAASAASNAFASYGYSSVQDRIEIMQSIIGAFKNRKVLHNERC